MKKFFKWIVIVFIGLVILGIYSSRETPEDKAAKENDLQAQVDEDSQQEFEEEKQSEFVDFNDDEFFGKNEEFHRW